MTACLHILHSTTDCCLFFSQEKLCFYLFCTRCFSISPLARAHSHCQMMARVGTIWPDVHYIGCGLAISDQIVAAFDWSCQLRRWPVGSQSSVTALRPIWTQLSFTMMMRRRRRNYWMWRRHQSVRGDLQNPPQDLWMLRSLVIHKTTCPVFAFLSQHQCVAPRIAL